MSRKHKSIATKGCQPKTVIHLSGAGSYKMVFLIIYTLYIPTVVVNSSR